MSWDNRKIPLAARLAHWRAVEPSSRLDPPNLELMPSAVNAVDPRAYLQAMADAPLRGGNREMSHDSLFGDSHKQKELF